MSFFNPIYSLVGFVVGLLVGMTGVGGGSLMTPLLVLVFGIHPVTAVGTDLLYAASSKTVGTAVHGWAGTIDWRVVGLLGAGSLPATLATIAWLAWLGKPSAQFAHTISFVLGVALLLTAICMLFRARLLAFAARCWGEPKPRTAAILTVLTGALLGVFVTLSSVGAGAIGVTVLMLLHPRMKVSRIIGSDIAHSVPLAFVAGFGHWLNGTVNWPLFLSLTIGSIPGIIGGSLLAARVPDHWLRPTLAVMLVLVGAKLVF